MRITLQYVDGCPNWSVADENLRRALQRAGLAGAVVEYQVVDTVEKAQECRFPGSPTILLDGLDPFAADGAAVGLSCRLFVIEGGLAGAPTVAQFVSAIESAAGSR
jgi:hypothetical protein